LIEMKTLSPYPYLFFATGCLKSDKVC